MSETIELRPGKVAANATAVPTDHPLCEQSKLLAGLIGNQDTEEGVDIENPKDKDVL